MGMKIEVFKIKDDNWAVRLPGFEITGFQSAPMAHVWVLQWLMAMLGKTLSDSVLKGMLKAGQEELDRIIEKVTKDEE